MKNLLQVKLAITMLLVFVGCGLLIAGLIIEPSGEIHNSVLVAFGEILTFVGMVFNLKYKYQLGLMKHERLYRWAIKHGVDLESDPDDLDNLDGSDKRKSQSSHDDRGLQS